MNKLKTAPYKNTHALKTVAAQAMEYFCDKGGVDTYSEEWGFYLALRDALGNDNDVHSCGPHCKRDACVAAREARTAERKRIVALLMEMHEKVTPTHNCYAYAADIVEASGEQE